MPPTPEPPPAESSPPPTPDARGPVDPAGAVPPPPPPRMPAGPGVPGGGYYPPPYPSQPSPRGNVFGRLFGGLVASLLFASIIVNVYLGMYFYAHTTGPTESIYHKGDSDRRIVIVPIDEVISSKTAKFVRAAFQQLEVDPPAALVLRVNSPGGTVGASDRIHYLVERFKKKSKGSVPIVASFGPVAASGGYYVAAGADHIVAEPGCITGSIGVMSVGFTVRELMDKIGVKPEILTATGAERKDLANNAFRDWTDEDRALTRKVLDHHFKRFKAVVEKGRGKKLTPGLDSVARGDIFTTGEAMKNGLIDTEGYLDQAIDEAKKLAKIPAEVEPQVTIMRSAERLGVLGMLSRSPELTQGITGQHVRSWLAELATPRFEYRWDPSLMGDSR